jgi:hypothetical protein
MERAELGNLDLVVEHGEGGAGGVGLMKCFQYDVVLMI